MRVRDARKRSGAFRGKRRKLCSIVLEELSGILRATVEVEVSVGVAGHPRVNLAYLNTHGLGVNSSGRSIRIGHGSSLVLRRKRR